MIPGHTHSPLQGLKMATFNARSLCNKTVSVLELLKEEKVDVCFMTETWLKIDDKAKYAEIKDHGFEIISAPRRGRGGGVAFVYNPSVVKLTRNTVRYSSFEVLEAVIKTQNQLVRLCVVYRSTQAASQKSYQATRKKLFMDQFSDYLDGLLTKSGCCIIAGDFNFHVEDHDDYWAKQFRSLYHSKGFSQQVTGETHISGGTLDLVLTMDDCADSVTLTQPTIRDDTGTSSDHYLVKFEAPDLILAPKQRVKEKKVIRELSKIDIDSFKKDLSSELPDVSKVDSLQDALEKYENTLTLILDRHAPAKEITVTNGKSDWWNDICQKARQQRRSAEQLFKKHRGKHDEEEYREIYKEAVVDSTHAISRQRDRYYEKRLSAAKGDSKATYRIINNLLDKDLSQKAPTSSSNKQAAEDLRDFFHQKVDKIYKCITNENVGSSYCSSPEVSALDEEIITQKGDTLGSFKLFTSTDVNDIIKSMNNKSCELDPVPTWLLKHCLPELLAFITLIVNISLQDGQFPEGLKSAIVRPMLKKSNLDSDNMTSYRPVSNLSFISKVIEKCAHQHLVRYLHNNGLFAKHQSGYLKNRSCETAITKIHNDVLLQIDKKNHTVLLLLDLSAAFDTINHERLISRLKTVYGFSGTILAWVKSYLSCRSFVVNVKGEVSSSCELEIGVPQGSILGPLFFILYTKELQDLVESHGLNIHLYADDTQIYLSFNSKDPQDAHDMKAKLAECFTDIKKWMTENYLKLNEDKSKIVEIAPKSQVGSRSSDFKLDISCRIETSDTARNLGFIFDSCMNLDSQINNVVRTCYVNQRNIGRIGSKLTKDLKIQMVHAFIHSILDSCNSAYGAITRQQLQKLQKVQNSAVRFVYGLYGKRRQEPIKPYLKELHFLPVYYRIRFKIALTVFKCINNLSPSYLSSMVSIRATSSHHVRRDNDYLLLANPPSPRLRVAHGAFSVTAPKVWNTLPYSLRSITNSDVFKKCLKTHLFAQAFPDEIKELMNDGLNCDLGL